MAQRTIRALLVGADETLVHHLQEAFADEVQVKTDRIKVVWSHAPRLDDVQTVQLPLMTDVMFIGPPAQLDEITMTNVAMAGLRLPVIAITSTDEEGSAAMARGMRDYVRREFLGSDPRSVHLMCRILAHTVTEGEPRANGASAADSAKTADADLVKIAEATSRGVLMTDFSGNIRFANARAGQIFECSPEELIGEHFPYPLPIRQPTEVELLHTGHHVVCAEVTSLETRWHGEAVYLISMRDITYEKRAESLLRRLSAANTRLVTALDTLNTGVLIIDPNLPHNPLIYINPTIASLTGYTPDELLGQPLDLLHGPGTDPIIVEHLNKAIEGHRSFHGILLSYRKNGEPFWNELSLNPVFDEQKRVTSFVGMQNDVTDRIQAMEQLHYRRRIESIVTTISSEFVNLPPDQIDVAITESLKRLGQFLHAERSYLVQLSSDRRHATNSHEWCADGVQSRLPESRQLASDQIRWWVERLQEFESVQFVNPDALPADAVAEREVLRREGVLSALVVPMTSDNDLFGWIGFETAKLERQWSDADVALLKLVGEILVRALSRKRTEQALRQSEERFRSVVNNTPMVMFTFDNQGILSFAAGNVLEKLTVDAASLIGTSFLTTGLAASIDPAAADNVKRTLTGESFLATIRVGQEPGVALETWYSPIRNDHGEIVGGSGVAIDVSEQLRAQTAEREQRTLADALRDTANSLTRSLDLETVMNSILDNVQRVVSHDAANIMILRPDGAQVVYARGKNRDIIVQLQRKEFTVPRDVPTIRYMLQTGNPCLVRDTTAQPGWYRSAETDWVRSYLGVPIAVFGEVVGFLNLDSETTGFFNEGHAERLRAFADQAAVALQNAQLFEQAKRDAQQLAVLNRATSFLYTSLVSSNDLIEVCYQIAEAVVREFGKVDCGVILVTDETDLTRVARAGQYQAMVDVPVHLDDPGPVTAAIRERRAQYVPDIANGNGAVSSDQRTRSRLVLPLVTSNAVIGVLDLNSLEPDAFREQDRRVLEAFAERASTAIENVRLYLRSLSSAEELTQRVRERTIALENERAQLTTILNSMEEGVVYWEADEHTFSLTIRYVNRAFTQIVGYSDAEMNGKPNFYMKIMPDPDERAKLIDAVAASMQDSSMARMETRFQRADGTRLDMLLTVSRLREKSAAAILRGVILARDISKEKALQEQKDRFIANASHELRTPLTNLKLRLYLLKAQPGKVSEHLGILESVTNRMQELVENLLDKSRFDRGVVRLKKARVVLQTIIHDVISHQQPHADEKNIRLRTEMPDEALEGEVDSDRLLQVITNLVVNAINYTPQGGQVLVYLQRTTVPDHPGEYIEIRVKDTGIGIPEAMQQHIFTPFFRANEGATRGTGLGLTIAQEIIRLHNGTISLESTPNVGTTFTVLLPA